MNRSARAGMTLIELTVGIVVTGLVVSAGYAAFSTIIDQRDRAAQVAAETAESVGIRQTIFHWLDGSIPRLSIGNSADPDAAYQLWVITFAKTPTHTPSSSVRLFIDDGRMGYGRGLVAVFRPDRGNDSIRVVLDSAARDLEIGYLVTGNGTRQWRTQDYLISNAASGQGARERPIAIRLRVISDDPIVSAAFADPIVAPINTIR